MKDSGQVALEYILIFAISLILLIVFTLPLTEKSVEATLDVSDTLDAKSNLAKIAQAIMQVYGEGQGSKQSINVLSKQSIKININKDYISSNLKLNDGTSKQIKVDYDSNLPKSSIYLSKGENIVIVEWPVDSENMRIYTKLF
ncbi:hypothetical protein [Methanobrevibacter sp.]|uniref:hypothetical protein n=1 Tax=Methanobrevibacter sp. TaxID=66852 RepID=UPI0025DA0AC8|nr:hypothetical protein [Methanobrevibacter sp.]